MHVRKLFVSESAIAEDPTIIPADTETSAGRTAVRLPTAAARLRGGCWSCVRAVSPESIGVRDQVGATCDGVN
jgi:hypothetical protein